MQGNSALAMEWHIRLKPKKAKATELPANVEAERSIAINLFVATFPQLARSVPDQVLTESEVSSFCVQLNTDCSHNALMQRLTTIVRILHYGREYLNWDVYIPSIPTKIKRGVNRFQLGGFNCNQANGIARALIKNLLEPDPPLTQQRCGRILLSALVFGGLTQQSKYVHLLRELPKMFHFHPGVLAICATKDGRNWTWFADPITQCLMVRWFHNNKNDHDQVEEIHTGARPIRAYLEYLGYDSSVKIDELRKQCVQRNSLRLEPFLVDFSHGKNISYPLPKSTWQRLYTSNALKDKPELEEARIIPINPQEHFTSNPSLGDKRQQLKLWKSWFRNQKEIVRDHPTFIDCLEHIITKYKDQLTPATYYLLKWGVDLATNIPKDLLREYPGREQPRLRTTSALKYMISIANFLITEAEDEDLAEFESDELHDLYAQVIALVPKKGDACASDEMAKTEKKRVIQVAEGLRRFHGFLRVRYGAVDVDFSDLLPEGGWQTKHKVDANLISYIEYANALTVLGAEQENPTDLQEMQMVLLILGFELGLRRGECLRLRICDIKVDNDISQSLMLVRSSRFGTTKSLSSVRKLPLGVLLEPASMDRIFSWHNKRIFETGSADSEALFLSGGQNNINPSLQDLFAPIKQAIVQVTGDRTLRFHHLRHSFANWTLVRMLSTTMSLPDSPFLKHPVFSTQRCNEVVNGLLQNSDAGRKFLYELARLMGHLSPETTLLSYVHILDWLLSQACTQAQNEIGFSAQNVSFLTGVSIDQVYYQNKKETGINDGHFSPTPFLSKIPTIPNENMPELVKPKMSLVSQLESRAEYDFMSLMRVMPRCLKSMYEGVSVEKVSRSSNVDIDTLLRWRQNWDWILSLKTGKNKKPRHINSATTKRDTLYLPLIPREKREIELCLRICTTFAKKSVEERNKFMRFFCYFLNNFTISSKGMTFSDESLLGPYITRLRDLGVYKKEICVLKKFEGENNSKANEEKKRIRELCPNAGIIDFLAPDSKEEALRPITLRVIDTGNKRNNPEKGVYYSNSGFRKAIYILSVLQLDPHDRQ